MFASLSLRFRVFLFFALLAAGGVGLAAGSMIFGWMRADPPLPLGPFVTPLILFAFLNTGLILAIWLLFDENVAKPIEQLSSKLRLGAHSGVKSDLDTKEARYLGDLAPAAQALARTADTSVTEMATQIAAETQRLKVETERLTAVLTEAPVATILLSKAQEIVLYDTQAADILSGVAQLRLRAPIADYFDADALRSALQKLQGDTVEVPASLPSAFGQHVFETRIKALSNEGYMIFIDAEAHPVDQTASRPLVFDFALMNRDATKDIRDTPLSDFCFVVFDTETTGLSIEKDAIVQIGAVRVLNGRVVDGEVFDSYVNPGRPIPPVSTEIHHVTDAHVADAPDIGAAGRAFHHFARDAVLVAHNAPFDIGLLRASETQMGVEWTHPVLDTVLLSAAVFGTTEEHSLDALCDRLSITIPAAHRHTAMGDAIATAEALVKLLPLLQAKGHETFGQLLLETRKHGRLLKDLNE